MTGRAHAATGAPADGGQYEIRVAAALGSRWAGWFDGLTLDAGRDGTTVIAGHVADQAALHGLLQRVRDLGVPLISVNRTDSTSPTHDRRSHSR